jgi:hypothetical protein
MNSILGDFPNMKIAREADNPLTGGPLESINTVRVGHQAVTTYNIKNGQSLFKDSGGSQIAVSRNVPRGIVPVDSHAGVSYPVAGQVIPQITLQPNTMMMMTNNPRPIVYYS